MRSFDCLRVVFSFFLLVTFSDVFSQWKLDHTKEWMVPHCEGLEKGNDVTALITSYDLSDFFLDDSTEVFNYGILGPNYQRFRVHVSSSVKDPLKITEYNLRGFHKTKSYLCGFSGEISVKKVYEFDADEEGKKILIVVSEFFFKGTTNRSNNGVIKGTLQTILLKDQISNKLSFYHNTPCNMNNTFVGVWRSYRTGDLKKAIWGVGKLPFTEDFLECDSEGKCMPNPKYYPYGWNVSADEKGEFPDNRPRWWEKGEGKNSQKRE